MLECKNINRATHCGEAPLCQWQLKNKKGKIIARSEELKKIKIEDGHGYHRSRTNYKVPPIPLTGWCYNSSTKNYGVQKKKIQCRTPAACRRGNNWLYVKERQTSVRANVSRNQATTFVFHPIPESNNIFKIEVEEVGWLGMMAGGVVFANKSKNSAMRVRVDVTEKFFVCVDNNTKISHRDAAPHHMVAVYSLGTPNCDYHIEGKLMTSGKHKTTVDTTVKSLDNKLKIAKKIANIDQYITPNSAIKLYNDLSKSLKLADALGINEMDPLRFEVQEEMFHIAKKALDQFETEAAIALGNEEPDEDDASCYLFLQRYETIIDYVSYVSKSLNTGVPMKTYSRQEVKDKLVVKIISSILDSCKDFVTASGKDGLEEVAALELVNLKVEEEKKKEEAKGNRKVLRFADGHQLYIDDGRLGSGPGWAAFNKENHSSNDAPGRRLWSFRDGIFSLEDGRQLFVRDDGWVFAASVDNMSGSEKGRRFWEVTDNGHLMQRGDKRKAYKCDGPWCSATANPPKIVSVFQFPNTYKRNGDTAYEKKSRKQRKGGGSTPNLNKTGRFDQDTIRALKKYLFFCGENPGKMDNKFGGVAEQALITFLAKADSFGFGSIFDCIKIFLKDQGFNDAANEEKNERSKYRSQMFGKECYIPSRALQDFLASAAANVNPFDSPGILKCTLPFGEIDSDGLCVDEGYYFPMGKSDNKTIWRGNNFSKFQYDNSEKEWNWINWENKVVCTKKSGSNYPPLYGWCNAQRQNDDTTTDYAKHAVLTYIQVAGASTLEEYQEQSAVMRVLESIDDAEALAAKFKAKIPNKLKERIKKVRHAIVEIVLRVAADSGDKAILNGALQLAKKERLPKDSDALKKATNIKVAIKIGAVKMELKRQPTININVIKNLTAPDNLELEIRRRQYFKNGGSIACPQCRDDGIKEPDDLCWMCRGTGETSKYITELEAPDNSGLDCLVCYDEAEYGLTTVCTHYYCGRCIQMTLKTALEMGQVPIYCPACKASHRKNKAKVGKVEETTLTFLERRNIISSDLQFRIMLAERRKRDASEQGKEFFACPAKCGNYLIHESKKCGAMQIVEGKNGPKMVFNLTKPGVCECGTLVCVKCHIKLDKDTWRQHNCNDDAKQGAEMDAKTLATLRKNAKRCPNCQAWVQKNSGCDTMMCGTNSHGSILQAIRNGGCGHQFYWSSLKPASTFYVGINGERRSGTISKEYRMQAMKKVFGEQL